MKTVSTERLANLFVEIADTLVDEFDLMDFLHMLTVRVAELVDAAAVGLLLADLQGQLRFMAASSENATVAQVFQIQTSEGPGLQAYRAATPVIDADLHTGDPRWPGFTACATAAGFRCVHAFPLRLRGEVIGALNVLSTDVGGGLDDAGVRVVQALADVTTIALLQERALRRAETLTEQLQGALNSRVVIEQAKGVIARAQGVSVDAAFDLMRRYARRYNRRLSDVAHAIASTPTSLPDLGES